MLFACFYAMLPRMSAKELIDESTLANWLTGEIRKQPGCERCTILDVYKLPQSMVFNGNWSIGAFVSSNPDQKACQCALDQVKGLARDRFDLA